MKAQQKMCPIKNIFIMIFKISIVDLVTMNGSNINSRVLKIFLSRKILINLI